MSVKEWLELGKPEGVKFVIEREADVLEIKDNPELVMTMAQLILDALNHYTNGQFGIEPLVTVFNPVSFKYKGHPFSIIVGGDNFVHVGALAYKSILPDESLEFA